MTAVLLAGSVSSLAGQMILTYSGQITQSDFAEISVGSTYTARVRYNTANSLYDGAPTYAFYVFTPADSLVITVVPTLSRL